MPIARHVQLSRPRLLNTAQQLLGNKLPTSDPNRHENQDGIPQRREIVINGKRLVIGITTDGVSINLNGKIAKNSKAVADKVSGELARLIEAELALGSTFENAMRQASIQVNRALNEKDKSIFGFFGLGGKVAGDGASTASIYIYDTTTNTVHTGVVGDGMVLP